MKYLVIFTFLISIVSNLNAQQINFRDTSLHFNQSFTKCEKRWVVLSPRDSDKTYNFGFIYIDEQAGFTYDLQGVFRVGENNKYIRDTVIFKKMGSIKYRISPNWKKVALLPLVHFAELGIKSQPEWVQNYYAYTDTIAHNYRWGWIYNDLDEPEIALSFLEKAYRANRHAKGVEFEMAYAYNSLNRNSAAIAVLEPALQNDSNNMLFYKELGYAYQHEKQFDKAIVIYSQGLRHSNADKSQSKGELAYNLAQCYKVLQKGDEYKKWMFAAKEYTPTNSQIFKAIVAAGF